MSKSLRTILQSLIPPFVLRLYRSLRLIVKGNGKDSDKLFDGHAGLFEELIRKVRTYGEYGVGKSTLSALANSGARVLSVDSSREWVDKVRAAANSDRLDVCWVDVGPVEDWGRPTTYTRKDNFIEYAASIWNRSERPELVLIDGRFRVCCFLYSVREAAPATKILFDDYRDRPLYHVVEEILRPEQLYGRQALFVVPLEIDRNKVSAMIDRFMYVFD